MGEVCRARDTRLDRTVDVKLLSSDLLETPGRRVERFRREARAIARITHPHICTLYDVGEDSPTTFLVMEYVDGVTLATRLEDGPLPMSLDAPSDSRRTRSAGWARPWRYAHSVEPWRPILVYGRQCHWTEGDGR